MRARATYTNHDGETVNDSLKDALQLLLAGLGIVSYFVIIVVELCSTPRFQLITNFLTAPGAEVEVGSFIIGTVAWIIFALMRKPTTRSTRPIDREAHRSRRGRCGAELVLAGDMEIIPNIGLGQLRFGMSPSQVQAVLGSKHTYEPWMGGNLNDSLLYPGLIIGFDKCDSSGPLKDSKLIEFTIKEKADVTFLKKPLFGMLENELVQTLGQHSIRSEKYRTAYLLPDLHMELDFDERGRVAWVVFEFGG
jgi:hypothetical protein